MQGDAEPVVREAQPQFVAVGLVRPETPFGAAPLLRPHGQRRTYEAGAALDGILLAPVEPGLEGSVRRAGQGGQRFGVREGDPWPPVEMEQFVEVGQP